jgi:predicted dehydrogenase
MPRKGLQDRRDLIEHWPMKFAFIGASHWHLQLYLEPVLQMPGVTIAGVADPDAKAVDALKAKLGCPGGTDFRELCRRVKPDFVIALGRHCDMADQARFLIGENIPFALEKPCGLSEREVADIAQAARGAGAFAAVPLVFRHGDFFGLLHAQESIQYMTFRFIAGFPQRYRAAGNDWMLDPALSGGGCTINLSPHFLDLALALMGPEVTVHQAVMSNAAWGQKIEDYSCIMLARGADRCVIETGYLFPAPTSTFDMHYAIRTPQRYIVAHDPETIEVVESDGTRGVREMLTTNVPHYRTFVFDVVERLRAGRPPLVSLSDYVPVARLVDAAYAKVGGLS